MLDNILSGNFTDREIFFLSVFVVTLPLTALGIKFLFFMLLPKFIMKKTIMKNYHDIEKKRDARNKKAARKRKYKKDKL